ncbi:hypothetical protein M885DRAFT_568233 [Pelagophyceae sp. CCMP2097]|nr:hypothetical protein M885DRAFT_568233 [Pelagophyceae sp. CCMP2097]
MKVIGLGCGRTGTDSLKTALVDLGFGPAYHMLEVLFEEQGMLSGFRSGADWPLSAFPEELLEAFPDAKFVLTVRPAAAWLRSLQESVCWFHAESNLPFKVLLKLPIFPFDRILAQKVMLDSLQEFRFGRDHNISTWNQLCDPQNADNAMAAFEQHNAHVLAVIPPKQLLVFEAGKSSYADLATFLNVETPKEAYPRVNSKKDFAWLIQVLTAAAAAVVAVSIAAVAALAFGVRCIVRRKRQKPFEKAD